MKTLISLLGVLAAVLLAAVPVGAHGGDGQSEITSVTRDGDEVTVVAHISYVADGHGVPDATVTVVVDDGTPVPMDPGAEEGDYQATVTAPPGATIRVTSVEPATSAEVAAPDTEEPTTTAAPETTETTEAPTTTAPEPTAVDGDDEASTPATTADDVDDDSDDSDGSPILIAVIAIVVVAAVVAAIVLRRKPAGGSDGDGAGA